MPGMTANPSIGQPRDVGGRCGRTTHAEQPAALTAWSDFDEVDAAAWQQHGVPHEMARDWRNAGFTAFGASDWRRHWFDPSAAAQWRTAGISAADAQHWRRLDFTPDAASVWLAVGLTPDEAASWRADGIPTPSDPNRMASSVTGETDPGFTDLTYRNEVDGYAAYAHIPAPSSADEPDWLA